MSLTSSTRSVPSFLTLGHYTVVPSITKEVVLVHFCPMSFVCYHGMLYYTLRVVDLLALPSSRFLFGYYQVPLLYRFWRTGYNFSIPLLWSPQCWLAVSPELLRWWRVCESGVSITSDVPMGCQLLSFQLVYSFCRWFLSQSPMQGLTVGFPLHWIWC